jgi:hypothetical protein
LKTAGAINHSETVGSAEAGLTDAPSEVERTKPESNKWSDSNETLEEGS